jgi:hypothetical protein
MGSVLYSVARSFGIHGQVAVPQVFRPRGAGPPAQCLDPGDHLGEIERLGQVVVGALGLQATGEIPLGAVIFEPGPIRVTGHAVARRARRGCGRPRADGDEPDLCRHR